MNRRRALRLQFHPPIEIRMVEIGVRRSDQLLVQSRIGELRGYLLIRCDPEQLRRRSPAINMEPPSLGEKLRPSILTLLPSLKVTARTINERRLSFPDPSTRPPHNKASVRRAETRPPLVSSPDSAAESLVRPPRDGWWDELYPRFVCSEPSLAMVTDSSTPNWMSPRFIQNRAEQRTSERRCRRSPAAGLRRRVHLSVAVGVPRIVMNLRRNRGDPVMIRRPARFSAPGTPAGRILL